VGEFRDLKWEKTAQYDVGLELGLFDIELAWKAIILLQEKNPDIAIGCPVPQSSGYATIEEMLGFHGRTRV